MKSFLLLASVGLAVTSCFRPHYPTSTFPGLASTTTGNRMPVESAFRGWPDDQVIHFKLQACQDSFRLAPLTYQDVAATTHFTKSDPRLPIGPGVVSIANDGLCMDEAEIPNREWRLYVYEQQQQGQPVTSLLPKAAALPVADYYSNNFYDFYPVVGISYEQAQAFCRWRSQQVSHYYNKTLGEHPDTLASNYLRVTYRLPTEAEWEHAAHFESRLPYGSTCNVLPVRVEPGAAAYLKQRSGSTAAVAEIRAEIVAYNATHPKRNRITCAQPSPDFLQLHTPSYIYQGPSNGYGLYQLLGNAAELVQEKGITKGGSYLDDLTACRIQARGQYHGPAPTIGFRTVFTLAYPNRR